MPCDEGRKDDEHRRDGLDATADDHRCREHQRARHDEAGSEVGRPAGTARPLRLLESHITLGACYELADLALDEPCWATSSGMSCSPRRAPSPGGERTQASNGRGRRRSTSRLPHASARSPGGEQARAWNGRAEAPSDESGSSRRRRCGQLRGLFASGTVVPCEGHRRRRDQPAEKHEIGNALLLGLDERRRFGALDDPNLDAVLHGDLRRELSSMEHVEEGLRGARRQLGRLGSRRRRCRADRHHWRRAADRGRHRGRGNRKRTVLQVLLVEQAAPLELPDDWVTGGESGVDVDQAREPTRVGEGRAEAAGAGRKHRPQLRCPLLRQHERRLVPPDLRASGSRSPTGRSERTDSTTRPIVSDHPDDHDRAMAPKNIRVKADVDLVPPP